MTSTTFIHIELAFFPFLLHQFIHSVAFGTGSIEPFVQSFHLGSIDDTLGLHR